MTAVSPPSRNTDTSRYLLLAYFYGIIYLPANAAFGIEGKLMEDPGKARRVYADVLDTARKSRTATDDQLRVLVPHITDRDGAAFIRAGAPVALPAIAVRGAFWRIVARDEHVIILPWRTPSSFGHADAVHKRFPSQDESLLYVGEALAYSREQWGSYMDDDTYASAVKIELRDPKGEGEGGVLAATAYAWLTKPLMRLDELVLPPALHAEEFEAALTSITTDTLPGMERCGWWPEVIQYCARCGHYLGFTQCQGCNSQFTRQPSQMRVLRLPMPVEVIKTFRRVGHEFAIQPQQWLQGSAT